MRNFSFLKREAGEWGESCLELYVFYNISKIPDKGDNTYRTQQGIYLY